MRQQDRQTKIDASFRASYSTVSDSQESLDNLRSNSDNETDKSSNKTKSNM